MLLGWPGGLVEVSMQLQTTPTSVRVHRSDVLMKLITIIPVKHAAPGVPFNSLTVETCSYWFHIENTRVRQEIYYTQTGFYCSLLLRTLIKYFTKLNAHMSTGNVLLNVAHKSFRIKSD